MDNKLIKKFESALKQLGLDNKTIKELLEYAHKHDNRIPWYARVN